VRGRIGRRDCSTLKDQKYNTGQDMIQSMRDIKKKVKKGREKGKIEDKKEAYKLCYTVFCLAFLF
jgi:hypothetical protein